MAEGSMPPTNYPLPTSYKGKFDFVSDRLNVLMEHIDSKCSLESELFFLSLCSIRILPLEKVMNENLQVTLWSRQSIVLCARLDLVRLVTSISESTSQMAKRSPLNSNRSRRATLRYSFAYNSKNIDFFNKIYRHKR